MNPDDDVMLRLQYYRETGQADHARDYEKYLRETGQWKEPATPRKMAAEEPAPEPGYMERLATHVLNAAQGIPGVEAVEAVGGMLSTPAASANLATPEGRAKFGEGYRKSLETLRGATEQIGEKTAGAEKMLGTVATLPFLSANPAWAGAQLGGADQLLSADPDESLAMRGLKTAGGAGLGYLFGKGADMALTGARSLLSTAPAKNLIERQIARAASAERLYGAALAEGQGKAASPQLQAYLAEPDVAEIVSELQSTRAFKGMAPESPEMLDAIYKTLSDRAATIKKGLVSVNPSKPNIGRFQAKDVQAAQAAGLTAMDATMPTYREAVADFAKHKAAEDAVARGYDAVRSKLLDNLPTAKNLTRSTPEAFAKWADTASPDESKAAVEGILGATKMALKKAPFTKGRKALGNASSLLRAANDETARFGILGKAYRH